MAIDKKHQVLAYLMLATCAAALLAASLSQLELKPGLPLPSIVEGQFIVAPAEEAAPVAFHVNSFLLTLFLTLVSLLVLRALYRLLQGMNWKQIARQFFIYFMVILITVGILAFFTTTFPSTSEFDILQPVVAPPPMATAPLGPTPVWLLWLVGILLAVSAALLAVWIFAPKPQPASGNLLLELEAEKARQALLNGLGLKEVILECYRQMSLILQREQGIERAKYMTAAEFMRVLQEMGYPYEPIHQLTGLFEAVRYGRWRPDSSGEQSAIACLEAIVQHSREHRKEPPE